jgi:hypothetical protein
VALHPSILSIIGCFFLKTKPLSYERLGGRETVFERESRHEFNNFVPTK